MLLTRDSIRAKDTQRLKAKGWKNISCKVNDKKAEVAILISEKVDFKTKSITKDKEGHYITIKRSIQEQYIIFVNIYTPKIGPPKYIKEILTDIKVETDNNT